MSGIRILLVDDEPAIHRFLRPTLTAAGYEIVPATTGREAMLLAATQQPDLMILDLGLPDMDGKSVIAQLRGWTALPIVVLSARDREAEKIEALDLGADDFVNKPFGVGELMARIRTALRRVAARPEESPVLELGDIVIDLPRHRVANAGVEVKLTPREFELLVYLARHPGKVLTHRQILRHVWGVAHEGDVQYLRVYIGQLRAKLEADPAAPTIVITEPGVGYRVAEPEPGHP
ncbi:response regulator [Aureimonas altamirensis]|uniref:response regulator n=1 Tax=Aureimonas altamirensis TaxID=370622 RepID=UPI0020367AD7|nr:response regulator [Aureimonas altamirensis]MCM2504332.1 response regulator [Aureimonas altamirensis]